MLLQIVALVALAIWYVALRPRKGGKNAPPTVTSSSVCRIPVVGVLVEFFKSPNTMVQRCVKDYGAVFTIPVRVGVCVCACLLPFFNLDDGDSCFENMHFTYSFFGSNRNLDFSQALNLPRGSRGPGNLL